MKERIEKLIQLKENEIEIWQNQLNEKKFEGFSGVFQIMYELHISQLLNTIEILKILKEKI
jgi:hypothetical protein